MLWCVRGGPLLCFSSSLLPFLDSVILSDLGHCVAVLGRVNLPVNVEWIVTRQNSPPWNGDAERYSSALADTCCLPRSLTFVSTPVIPSD